MIKKLFSLFTSTRELDSEGPFFRKNADGQIIYYPWSYPGEGYLITEASKKNLFLLFKVFEYGLFGTFIILVMLSFLDVLKVESAVFYILGISMLSTLSYLALIYLISKKATPYILPDPDRPTKDRNSNAYLWFAIIIQILSVAEVISNQNLSLVVALALSISSMIYCLFLFWLIRAVSSTKGYVFNK